LWQGICVLLVFLWLITFIAWRRARAMPRAMAVNAGNAGDAPQRPPSSLRRACLADDARAAHAALLRWASLSWPEHPPRGLPGLAERLADAPLRAQLATLDRALYAPHSGSWRGEPLWRRARTKLVKPTAAEPHQDNGLADLYPRHG
jgi:hypothetical protein